MPRPLDEPDSTAPGARRWTPLTASKRALEVLRSEGARALIARSLADTVHRRLLLLERDLRPAAVDDVAPSGLAFGWLEEGDVDRYETLRPGEGGRALARLGRGDRCFCTWLDGELVATRWVASGSAHVEYLDVALLLRDGEAYHYDSFTSPQHRRRGLSTGGQARLFDALRAEGRSRIVRTVLPENGAAVADSLKLGFRRCGKIGYVRLGRRRWLLGGDRVQDSRRS